ncbi:MAG: glycosyl hydrolase-related protein [Fimbriimonadales bacterium]
MPDRIPLYYTFGNHQHWVDLQWLWGYDVLPGAIRDMLLLCREAGVKGCVNFDGIGYEKLAAEDPEAFASLKAAVQDGTFEIVGGSYGQPYGLFHGGESNVRQRIFGARAVKRLFGVPVKTFWEEEFDFFPQLPQILRGVGIEYSSLFFQWTWHTPEVPREEVPVVWWEGQDGSKLLCATRNKLNLHQWPEDMDIVLASLAEGTEALGVGRSDALDSPTPLILQWLELMPTPDWMCRSELILPKLKQLMSDPRFEVRPVTLGGYFRSIGSQPMGSTAFQAVQDSAEPIEMRQGAKLPHWTRENATYHVVFRLADAVPTQVQREWKVERKRLEELAIAGRLTNKEEFEYRRLLEQKIEDFLDAGHGSCQLRERAAAGAVRGALEHFDGERYGLVAWCVMPNHVHVLVQPFPGHTLDEVLHSWKSLMSNKVNSLPGRRGPLWQSESYDHLVRNMDELYKLREYVLQNPAKAKLSDWPWVWSLDLAVLLQGQDAPGTHRLEADATPVRQYTMDQVWHGMTLGKNGDNMRRLSREAEASLLSAETLAAIAGLFGRPYAQWDAYPTWELEEAWRELLSAQHHDNDECEGLCGHVGRFSYERSLSLSRHVKNRNAAQIMRRINPPSEHVQFNSLGWDQISPFGTRVPAFGYATLGDDQGGAARWAVQSSRAAGPVPRFDLRGVQAVYSRPGFKASFDGSTGYLSIAKGNWSEPLKLNLGNVTWVANGKKFSFAGAPITVLREGDNGELWFELSHEAGPKLYWMIDVAAETDAIDVELVQHPGLMPDPGLNASLQWKIDLPSEFTLLVDTPYGVHPVKANSTNRKKYPSGDWMTSKQWFETVEDSFTALSFVNAAMGDRSLLVLHDGSQQWFRRDGGISCVVSAKDPWDEDYYAAEYIEARFRLCPHSGLSASKSWKLAQEFRNPVFLNGDPSPNERFMLGSGTPARSIPTTFSAASCDAPNVALTAFYRETRDCAKGQESHAADILGVDYPYVLRMVELDGIETEAALTFGATVAGVVRTNLLGEPDSTPLPPSSFSRGSGLATPDTIHREENEEGASRIRVHLRPYEIATLYLDLVEGRKQVRDLDAKREIWATVHRV